MDALFSSSLSGERVWLSAGDLFLVVESCVVSFLLPLLSLRGWTG